MYTIGQVSKMFDIPISTLRYYDKEGLFPHMQRTSGIRNFTDNELETLRVIDCLKKSGLEIKEIKQFMEWCSIGPTTYKDRYELFVKQKQTVEDEIEHMKKTLDMIKYKCWFYEQLLNNTEENHLRSIIPDGLPEDIKACYKHAHED